MTSPKRLWRSSALPVHRRRPKRLVYAMGPASKSWRISTDPELTARISRLFPVLSRPHRLKNPFTESFSALRDELLNTLACISIDGSVAAGHMNSYSALAIRRDTS